MTTKCNGLIEMMVVNAEIGGSKSKDSALIVQRVFDLMTIEQRRRLVSAIRTSASAQLAFIRWIDEEHPGLFNADESSTQ